MLAHIYKIGTALGKHSVLISLAQGTTSISMVHILVFQLKEVSTHCDWEDGAFIVLNPNIFQNSLDKCVKVVKIYWR